MRSILRHFPAKLLILLLFCFQLNKAEAQTTLAAGDLAFVGYISADDGVNGSTQDDEFSFILLKDINSGTIINFTDFGWLTAGAFQTANPCGANTGAINDGIIRWTSTSALTCGTQIRIKCKYGLTATTGTVTGIQACNNDAAAFLSLSIGGDQIFAYQGLHTSPTLIAGISLNKAWDASLVACFFSSNSSVLPAALASANNTAITAGINAKYNCSTANNIPAVLIPAINNAANWNTDNTFAPPVPVAFNLPLACSFSCVAGPTIFASPVTGTITACAGTASVDPDLQQFSVSGAQLTGNITITAPTNFQISTTIGSGYTGSITLTQSGGIVTATTIYVRSAATAPAGPISGNVNLTSAGATAVDVAVSGTINPIPDAIATPASQTVCSGTPITSIAVSGAVPSTTFNWSRDNTVAVTGIAANGSGDISGTLVNTTGSPVTVAFTITPIANGCTGTPITATVLVNPAPNATITGGNNITCQGVTTTLSSPNIPGVTYNWERSLSGLTGSFSAAGSGPTLGVTSSGIYRFVATDGNGCSATSDTNNVTVADYVFNGSLAAGDAQQTGRLNRFAALSTCAVPKVCPGTFTTTGSRYYDVYSITNPRAVPVCATIGIASGCGTSIFSVAYLGSFDPLNLCTNYLADPGSSFPGVAYYEATIPAGATIQIVVHEVNVGTGCGNYTVTVDLPRETPAVISGAPASPVCAGSTQTLTASVADTYLWSPGGQTTQSINVNPVSNTTYSVTLGYGNNGCSAVTPSVTINVNALPDATITGGNNITCQGVTTTLSSPNIPGVTYNWERSLSGLTGSFSAAGSGPTLGVTSSGIYRFVATDGNGCSATSDTNNVTVADYVFNGSLAAGDAQQTGRLNRFAALSTCAVPKVCPGTFTTTGSRYYDVYSITNPRAVPVCATIGIASGCGTSIFSVAYLGSFDPLNLCTNYLADPGSSFPGVAYYEATIPAGATIQIVVHEVNVGTGCGNYTVTVDLPRDPSAATPVPASINCGGSSIITASLATSYLWSPGGQTTQSITVSPLTTTNYSVTLGYGNNGCTATANTTVTVVSTPPTISCPGNITLANTTGLCGRAVTYTTVPGGTPAPTLTYTFTGATTASGSGDGSGSFFNKGTTTVTVTATNACGNSSCSFTVTINDTEAPAITCPAPVTVSCATAVPAANIASVIATDNCPGVVVTHRGDVISSQTCANRFIITRTYRATDAANNFTECTQTITVNDVTPPVITCPAALTVSCASAVPAPNTALVTATDNCAGAVTIIFISDVISNQTCANRYLVTRTYRATDVCGNFADCTQTITVNDVTPPVITCPAALTVSCASAVPAPNTALVTATDNCAGAVTITFISDVISNQTCANRYLVTRTYRATDVCGNFADCTQTITVNDVTPPVITCPAAVTVSCASAVPAPNTALVTATDNCAGAVTITFVNDVISGQTCPNRYTVTRTYRATDVCGNSSTCTQIITVNDQTAPVLTCPANINVLTPIGSCTAIVNFTPTATDNCNGAVTIVSVPASGSVFPIGTTTVNVTATDACGNSSTCSFTVTVVDAQLPVISQQPLTKFVCDGTNAVFTVVSTNALSYQWQQWNGTAWVNIAGATTATLTINAASFTQNTNTYRVAVIGLCTTVQSAAASLYVNPLPTVNLSTSIPPFLSPGQSMSILSSVNPSGGTYRWFLNGSLISAAQGSSLNGITVDGQGTYRLVYTDPNGCTNNSIDIVVVGQQSNDLWIYPNPNQGSFNVRFFNKAGEKVTVNVMDAKGRRVYSKEFTTVNAYTNMLVDLAAKGMADGTYFVTVVGQNGSIIGSKKILVYRR